LGEAQEWARNIVAYKTIDFAPGPGRLLADLLHDMPQPDVPDLAPEFAPLVADARDVIVRPMAERRGQGTFRTRVLTAYQGRCAATGERAVPALDAAHIQPHLGPASNHIQNGLLLRADLHRLYDAGYVTVTPDLRLEVSGRLRDDFENGRLYYAMAGRQIAVPSNVAW
jgi:putative restriction endonuclease